MIISSRYDLIVQGEICDSRFNKTGIVLWVNIEYLVHPPTQVKYDSSPNPRGRTPISH